MRQQQASSANCLHLLATVVVVASLLLPDVVRALPADESSNGTTSTLQPGGTFREARKFYDKQSPANGLKKRDDMTLVPQQQQQQQQATLSGIVTPTAILHQLDWKSLISTAIKMFFGSSDEQSKQASRQMVDMIVGLIDGLRLSFTTRKAQARSNGHEMSPTTDAALAGLSMLKAYVKTIVSQDEQCVKKYLCQANREAVRDGNKVGYVIAQFGSYATSYMLENFQTTPFDENFSAAKEGRNGANCEEVFQQCNELH